MLKKTATLTTVLCCSYLFSFSQNMNSNWVFGDSAGINFSSLSNPVTFGSGMDGRGSCVSMSDSAGNLLFYAFTRAAQPISSTTLVYESTHHVMPNGDTIAGSGWYLELVSVPDPGNSNQYYLFSLGANLPGAKGVYYSKIDMSLNNGLGDLIIKNTQLESFLTVDCLYAVKHGNGRDWWIIARRSDPPSPTSGNSDWYRYLLSPSGIDSFAKQTIGTINRSQFGQIDFSPDGNKLVFTGMGNVIEVFDFDRCMGLLSNPVTIDTDPMMPPYKNYWSVAFSNDASKLYITSNDITCYLFQFDLTAANIAASKDTLWIFNFPKYTAGKLKLSKDGKIYLPTQYYNGFNFPYPYADSVRNYINENLSVINHPDSLGAACNFQPWSFYLGSKRAYIGLPNNPDYLLGPKIGSGCDTLTAINEHSQNLVISNLAPNPNNGEFTVSYFLPNGKSGELEIFNVTGQRIFHQHLPRYTYLQNISLKNLPQGMYLLKISGGGKVGVKRFVVNH